MNTLLIQQWNEAKKALDAAKAAEMELRKSVIAQEFAFDENDVSRKGTENIELGHGYKLKAVFKIAHKIQGDIDGALNRIGALGAEGQLIAERAVKWKAELSVTEYEKMPHQMRAILDECVVTSCATPSLEIVEPKGKK